jgi:hypothetical protein
MRGLSPKIISGFLNSNQFLKQRDISNSKQGVSNFFSKSNFKFESVWILRKELHTSLGSCLRRKKGGTGPWGELL